MTVKLFCKVCGNDQFSAIEESIIDINEVADENEWKCSDCQRIATKRQIIEENKDVIDANMEELKKEAIKELEKELKKILK